MHSILNTRLIVLIFFVCLFAACRKAGIDSISPATDVSGYSLVAGSGSGGSSGNGNGGGSTPQPGVLTSGEWMIVITGTSGNPY